MMSDRRVMKDSKSNKFNSFKSAEREQLKYGTELSTSVMGFSTNFGTLSHYRERNAQPPIMVSINFTHQALLEQKM